MLYTHGVIGSNPIPPTIESASNNAHDYPILPNSPDEKCSQPFTKFTSQLLEEFMNSRTDGCSPNTIKFYRYTLTHFIGYPLTPQGVNAYIKSLTCRNGKARYYQALKTLFLWLYNNEYTQVKIIDKVPAPKVQKKIMPVISIEQYETLLNHCHCNRDKAVISLLWYSGIRLSECANAQASHFNWEEGTILVLGKGNKFRKALAGNGVVKEWFTSHSTFEIDREGIKTMLRRLGDESGIKCNAHSFRRGFAIHNLKSGLSTRIVQSLGGWESISMVERYSRSLSFEDALNVYKSVNTSNLLHS